MSQETTKQASEPSLQDRTIETIKQAHELLTETTSELDKATQKLSHVEADDRDATPLREDIINKLASTRYQGEFLVPPHARNEYLEGTSTKHGMAQLASQLVDLLFRTSDTDKTATSLGEAATVSSSSVDDSSSSVMPRSLSVRM